MHVVSSNVSDVSWTADGLTVTFRSGSSYTYDGVPVTVAFEVAVGGPERSVGRAFNRLIRGRYPYRRLYAHEVI